MALKNIIFILLFSSTAFICAGQQPNLSLEMGTYISSSGKNPFWLQANKYGTVPNAAQSLSAILKLSQKGDSSMVKPLHLMYGAELVPSIGKANQVVIPELFIGTKHRFFEFYIGRKKEIFGLVDSSLSSGSFIWSGNTIPIPKIQISTPGYIALDKQKLISVNLGYAHGWFDNRTPLKNSYLHQKWFYLQLGKPNWSLQFNAGFNHQVQWGGKLNLPYRMPTVVNNQLPKSFKDYIYLISGISLNYADIQSKLDSNYTPYDLENRVGNHIGTIDISAKIRLNQGTVQLYKQSVYDDGTLITLSNIVDGLTGLSFTNKHRNTNGIALDKIIVEIFQTQNQGGSLGSDQTIPEIRGRDDYFNHGQFINGWAYNGSGIGSPFIIPQSRILSSLPSKYIAGTPLLFFTNNNRVKAYYLALGFSWNDMLTNITKFSISDNLGSYQVPFSNGIRQVSFFNTTAYLHPSQKILYKFSIAYDSQGILPKSFGIYFGLQKQLLFKTVK